MLNVSRFLQVSALRQLQNDNFNIWNERANIVWGTALFSFEGVDG